MIETTRDSLLGGRVTLWQPAGGHRAAIDPVLLAAAVPAGPGETVLDVGSGTGAAALALAARIAGVRVTGLETQPDLVKMAQLSAGESNLAERAAFVEGDLLAPPAGVDPGGFDHVMANPPYLAPGQGNPPPDAGRRAATVEGRAGLADWLRFALAMCRQGGTVTVIHRHDRKDEVVAELSGEAGGIVVFPLWPKKQGEGAKRVIVQGWKGTEGETRQAVGLVLHQANGGYTPEAETVLRGAKALRL